MSYCDNKTSATVIINGMKAWFTRHPPITVDVFEDAKCQRLTVNILYEYMGLTGWLEWTVKGDVYGPVRNARINYVSNSRYAIQVFAHGKAPGTCLPHAEWVTIAEYSGQGRNASISEITQEDEGQKKYSLSIKNKNGVEEFLKVYDERPEYQVICGCDVNTELECLADNEKGFCCIPCNEIVSRIKAIQNILNK